MEKVIHPGWGRLGGEGSVDGKAGVAGKLAGPRGPPRGLKHRQKKIRKKAGGTLAVGRCRFHLFILMNVKCWQRSPCSATPPRRGCLYKLLVSILDQLILSVESRLEFLLFGSLAN